MNLYGIWTSLLHTRLRAMSLIHRMEFLTFGYFDIVSADMAHGVHPNFMDKHEEHHRPLMHKGLVIKHNANQRYATSGVTAFLFKEVAKIHNIPTQVHEFHFVAMFFFSLFNLP